MAVTPSHATNAAPVIGRSHGIHAEPTTFGLKLIVFLVGLYVSISVLEPVGNTAGLHKEPSFDCSVSAIVTLDKRSTADFGVYTCNHGSVRTQSPKW